MFQLLAAAPQAIFRIERQFGSFPRIPFIGVRDVVVHVRQKLAFFARLACAAALSPFALLAVRPPPVLPLGDVPNGHSRS